ncbi:MAG: ribosomal protein S18-alanine N-acetyltransferase [Nitrososphaeria archaeon]|nr:ribosomal protein S18-alanine N-acetyltransferase [Nitrososphaeria archaeon]
MIGIRKYNEKDLEKILEIERSSFKFPYPKELFKELLSMKQTRMLVAKTDSEKIVGYILYSIKSQRCLLVSIAVVPEYRRMGVGTMLMKAFLDDVKNVVEKVELQVGCSNLEAINFYHKFGFKVNGILKNYYPDGEDALYMVKYLN